jgi:sigma-B regulation protein RsbU (phosphoserine phosphatase)
VGVALYYHKFIDQQSRLIDESLAHVQALKAMGELLGELDEELVLAQILKFFVDLVDAEVGAAILRDGSHSVTESRWGLPAEVLEEMVAAVDEGQVKVEGIFQRVLLPAGRFASFSLATVLHLPIALKAPHGANVFLVSGERLDVSAHRQELIESCLNIGGIALQKALDHREQIRQHRLNEQLKVAKEIQSKLLPAELPRLARLDIAGVSLPALAVGGDYYDVFTLPGGDLLAIVADVSGKGIQAAIRMSGLQAMMHSLVFQDLRPGEVLERLNELLVTSRLQGHFVTACVLRVERGGGRIRMASAGHEAVLRASPGEPAHPVEAPGGLPLGLRSGQEYPEHALELDAGDRLLVYTDGMTDARDPSGALYGAGRLSERLAAEPTETSAALLDRLVDDLERYRGEQPWSDDLTALTFHYQSEGKQ